MTSALDLPSITIFTTTKKFEGHNGLIQTNALKSWSKLEGVEVLVLAGAGRPREVVEALGARCVDDVQCSESGAPMVDDLFRVGAREGRGDVLAYVNADIILTPAFVRAVRAVRARHAAFLMIGQRIDVDITHEIDVAAPAWDDAVVRLARQRGSLHAPTGIDYFVHVRGVFGAIPPFALGRSVWDNWLVHRALSRGVATVDATHDVPAIHQNHDYAHLKGGIDEAWNGPEAKRNQRAAKSTAAAAFVDDTRYLLVDGEFKRRAFGRAAVRRGIARIEHVLPPTRPVFFALRRARGEIVKRIGRH